MENKKALAESKVCISLPIHRFYFPDKNDLDSFKQRISKKLDLPEKDSYVIVGSQDHLKESSADKTIYLKIDEVLNKIMQCSKTVCEMI